MTKKQKQAEARKHLQHIIFYSILGVAIILVRVFYPVIIDTAIDDAHTIAKKINMVGEDLITAGLTIGGLIYTWKKIFK